MKIIDFNIDNTPVNDKDLVLCLGFYDGLHLGHQKLIKRALDEGYPVGVMTFDVAPAVLLGKKENYSLTSTFDKADMRRTDLTLANLSYGWFFQADLSDSILNGANLYEINGNGMKAKRTNFTSAKLGKARLANGDFTEAVFENAMLDNANLKGAVLKNTVWGTAFKEKAEF